VNTFLAKWRSFDALQEWLKRGCSARMLGVFHACGTAAILSAPVLMFLVLPHVQSQNTPQKTGPSTAGNAENGKHLYASYGCYECHGREGQGSVLTGPRLALRPPPFSVFTSYVRQPAGQMPPYTAKVVPDAELADIYAFLKSLPAPPKLENIPLLK
jgi:mono/diheme cytochrome c family protein